MTHVGDKKEFNCWLECACLWQSETRCVQTLGGVDTWACWWTKGKNSEIAWPLCYVTGFVFIKIVRFVLFSGLNSETWLFCFVFKFEVLRLGCFVCLGVIEFCYLLSLLWLAISQVCHWEHKIYRIEKLFILFHDILSVYPVIVAYHILYHMSEMFSVYSAVYCFPTTDLFHWRYTLSLPLWQRFSHILSMLVSRSIFLQM